MGTQRRNMLRAPMHFVWATHDRLPLITPEIERRLYRYIEAICIEHKCPVLAIGGMPDHIHLLVAHSNTITFSDLMKHVKGSSSRFITTTLKPGEAFNWRPNYGAFAVSYEARDSVIAYIHNQKQHHANNDLWEFYEQTDEEVPDDAPDETNFQ